MRSHVETSKYLVSFHPKIWSDPRAWEHACIDSAEFDDVLRIVIDRYLPGSTEVQIDLCGKDG